jgi:hypothetical protein
MNDRQIARHDFTHESFARAFAAQHDFARVIPLRDQPHQLSFFKDQKRADVLVRHELDRFEHSCVRRD